MINDRGVHWKFFYTLENGAEFSSPEFSSAEAARKAADNVSRTANLFAGSEVRLYKYDPVKGLIPIML